MINRTADTDLPPRLRPDAEPVDPGFGIRREYVRGALDESDLPVDPIAMLRTWLDDAHRRRLEEPGAMALATVDGSGIPSCRYVLLRGLDERGLRFFTSYESQKGRHLAVRPLAAATFWWPQLERQVRVEGDVELLPAAESDDYFWSRPRDSQLSAWSSPQSAEIMSRDELERRVRDVEARFEGVERIPRPNHWGGYLLQPTSFEFWQGRPSRRHDRLVYRCEPNGGWNTARLAP